MTRVEKYVFLAQRIANKDWFYVNGKEYIYCEPIDAFVPRYGFDVHSHDWIIRFCSELSLEKSTKK